MSRNLFPVGILGFFSKPYLNYSLRLRGSTGAPEQGEVVRAFVLKFPLRRLNSVQLISLRKFQAYLGLGYSYQISGDTSAKQDKVKKSWKGSDLVRSHLSAHALVTICPNKPAKTEIIGKLKNAWQNSRTHTYYKRDDKTGQKIEINDDLPSLKALGKDGLCRLLFYETRLLYQLLTHIPHFMIKLP